MCSDLKKSTLHKEVQNSTIANWVKLVLKMSGNIKVIANTRESSERETVIFNNAVN